MNRFVQLSFRCGVINLKDLLALPVTGIFDGCSYNDLIVLLPG